MPSNVRKKRSGETTRQRILKAAVARFARSSYEEVKLRDIARDVGVDQAYVHRSFGSKEQLLVAAFDATAHTAKSMLAGDKGDHVGAFTRHVLGPESLALRIFSYSLSSAQARKVLRRYVMKNFIGPLAAELSEPALLRACFVAACLTGIKVQRDVLCLHPLSKAPRAAFLPLFEAIMRACLETEIVPGRAAGAAVAKRPRSTGKRMNGGAQPKVRKPRSPALH